MVASLVNIGDYMSVESEGKYLNLKIEKIEENESRTGSEQMIHQFWINVLLSRPDKNQKAMRTEKLCLLTSRN
jgi:hypothetical protein